MHFTALVFLTFPVKIQETQKQTQKLNCAAYLFKKAAAWCKSYPRNIHFIQFVQLKLLRYHKSMNS